MNRIDDQPHAPDVQERETSDGGFSAGWGLHMLPSVRYWLDCHTHMGELQTRHVLDATAQWHDFMWGHRLRRHVALDGDVEHCRNFAAAAQADDRLLWLCRLHHDEPNLEHLEHCKQLGAVGIKLHNAKLIINGDDRRTVLSEDWHKIYRRAGQLDMPILWHVTQRLTDAPYTGGGRNSYWKDAPGEKPLYTNEQLLGDFLEAVAAHRDTWFIGAHQLHLGPDRMAELFAQHPNLVVDTSIGCYVAPDDVMYEEDRRRWRDFFISHPDRILFGTDVVLKRETASTELLRQHFLGHVRFIKQLRLPQDVLSMVAHENFERIARLEPVKPLPWGALRP